MNPSFEGLPQRLMRSVDVGVEGKQPLPSIDNRIGGSRLFDRFVDDIHEIQNLHFVWDSDAETSESSQVRPKVLEVLNRKRQIARIQTQLPQRRVMDVRGSERPIGSR